MSIGFQIRWIRESKKWKQEDLAKRTGITQARISNYENDVREPTRKNLQKIADALSKPIEFFYREAELRIKEPTADYIVSSGRYRIVIHIKTPDELVLNKFFGKGKEVILKPGKGKAEIKGKVIECTKSFGEEGE